MANKKIEYCLEEVNVYVPLLTTVYLFLVFLLALGVGHKPQSISFVWCTDTTSWQYGRPEGVTFSFQVIRDFIHPSKGNCVANLLAKND